MKNIIKTLAVLYLFICGMLFSTHLYADPPAPPPPGGHGSSTNEDPAPVGGPIDHGLGILLALGTGYGCRKLYKARQKKEAEVAG